MDTSLLFEYFFPLFYGFFFCLGIIFGSFASVLIHRWKNNEGGIYTGRSKCPHCQHLLLWYELIPLLSFCLQKGTCRACHTKISPFYLLVELSMGIVFCLMAFIGYTWGLSCLSFSFLLLLIYGFITCMYMFYDIRYMEIPENIMVFGVLLFLFLFVWVFLTQTYTFFPDSQYFSSFSGYIKSHLGAALLLYTFVFLQILIPATIFLWQKKRYKDIGSLCFFYVSFLAILLYDFFSTRLGKKKLPKKEQAQEEDIPTWIGIGDLWVAAFIGVTLGMTHAIAAFFGAYCIGSIVGIGMLLSQTLQKKPKTHEIAFGPFLALGWLFSLFFYTEINLFVDNFLSWGSIPF